MLSCTWYTVSRYVQQHGTFVAFLKQQTCFINWLCSVNTASVICESQLFLKQLTHSKSYVYFNTKLASECDLQTLTIADKYNGLEEKLMLLLTKNQNDHHCYSSESWWKTVDWTLWQMPFTQNQIWKLKKKQSKLSEKTLCACMLLFKISKIRKDIPGSQW